MDRNQLLNDNEEAMRLMLDGRQSGIWSAIPCIVESVDFSKMIVSAQPTIQGTVEDENGNLTSVNLPLLINVPLVFPSAGGFMLTFPVAVNDEVLVVFSSRCIDAWWQSGGIQRPMEARMHDLSDGFAIPGPKSVPNVFPTISSTAVQLRNKVGTTYLEISAAGKISLVSATELDIIAPIINYTGALTLTGALNVTGALTAASVVAGGKNLATHTHLPGTLTSPSGAVTGDTGAPV